MKKIASKVFLACLGLTIPMASIGLSTSCNHNSKYYLITWLNDDDSILKQEKVLENTLPTFEETPTTTKIGYTCTFTGWDKQIKIVTSDATYKAVYNYEQEKLELPILNIKTEDGQPIVSKETYKNATIEINNTSQYPLAVTGCQIKGRGNSSWDGPKKPYKVKFNEKQSIFGSSYKAKKWCLIPNYFDRSLIRNWAAYKLASYMDDLSFTPATNLVDVYLNGTYDGVYLLTDQIEVNEGRINIDDTPVSTGDSGFMLEYTSLNQLGGLTEDKDYVKFWDDHLQTYIYLEIKSPDTSSELYQTYLTVEINFLKTLLNNIFTALDASSWQDVTNLMNVDSFADGYIIEEVFANPDCWNWSMFYYRDAGGKFTHGPVWDFDISAGNCNYGPGRDETMPADEALWAATENFFYRKLLTFNEFKTLVATKLQAFKTSFQTVMNYLDVSNENGLYLTHEKAWNRNLKRWPIMEQHIWPSPKDVDALKNIKEHQAFVKNWLEKRFAYLETIYK